MINNSETSGTPSLKIKSVVFDVGEVLLNDNNECQRWADWLDVPLNTFAGVLGAVIATGRGYDAVFETFRPGFDIRAEQRKREAAGCGQIIDEHDLYPDVRPALTDLQNLGIWVGVAGNQAASTGELLRKMELPIDHLVTSDELGVTKPNLAFFDHVKAMAPGEPHEILYVGDNPENDLFPAHAAGLSTAFLRRGVTGWLYAQDEATISTADYVIDSLAELPKLLKSGVSNLA